MGSGKLLGKAKKKYGPQNFTKEILIFCTTKEELSMKEKEFIASFNSLAPFGYNLHEGGYGGFSYINDLGLGNCRDIEHLKRIRKLGVAAWKEKREGMSAEEYEAYRKRLSRAQIATIGTRKFSRHFLGKHHTQETRDKLSEHGKARNLSGSSNPQFGKRWVIEEETGKLLSLRKEISLPEGFIEGRVPKRTCLNCQNAYKKATKYCSIECANKCRALAKKNRTKEQIWTKPLINISTGETFTSVKKCAEHYNKHPETIRLWLKAGKFKEIEKKE